MARWMAPVVASLTLLLAPTAAHAASFNLIAAWGTPGTAPGQFGVREDVAVSPTTLDVYTGENQRVQQFNASGGFIRTFGSPGPAPGQYQQIDALGTSSTGELFVVDTFSNRITRLTPAGAVTSTWGVLSATPGAGFSSPEGIVLVGSDTAYVADRGRQEIDQYTAAGTWVRSFAPPVLSSRVPVSVTADSAGNVYSVDRDGGKVDEFTPTGGFIRSIGVGRLNQPVDAAVDTAGNVYVAETSNRRVSKFTPSGSFAATYDRAGTRTFNPVAIEVAPSGDLYIADGAFAPNGAILRVRDGPLPAPVLGKAVNVQPVKGKVLVALPGKGQTFVPLDSARQIPVGSQLDTKRGTARVTSATGSGSKTQTGDFNAGVFQALQSGKRSQKGLTELRLKGSSFKSCKAGGARAVAAAKSKRKIRRLRGNAKGRFRTRGRYSSATVRGTDWTVTDRCDGTLTTVKRGKVAVADFRRHKTILVRRGKSYLARGG